MRLADLLALVTGAFSHRVRAALTLLGVTIGTASIVLLASLLHGGEGALLSSDQEASDEDIVEVHAEDPPGSQLDRTTRPLSRADSAALATTFAGALVQPETSFDDWAHREGKKKRVALVSGNAVTLALYRLKVASGRFLDEDDERAGRRVCVVGREVYEDLLSTPGRGNPGPGGLEGMRLEIAGTLLSVVGVLEKKPSFDATDSTYLWDRKVMIPERTYDALFAPSHDVGRVYVRKPMVRPTPAALVPIRDMVHAVLLRRHLGVTNFALGKDETGGEATLILTIIQILLFGTGLLALLASGINIMNVMLVTVSERTTEIGLRRAIGATPRVILAQFLLEAGALSLAGGVVGIACGASIAWGTAMLARSAIGAWDFALPAWSLALGLALALLTGLGFGLLPAWRAARIAPIDALRGE